MATVDVTVRGGGIFGLSIAWSCLRRGARVRLIEKNHIGAGASGGVVGALAPHVPENWNAKKAFQLESLLMAETWWAEVTAAAGLDPGYARTGRLQPLTDQAAVDLANSRAAGATKLWQGRAEWLVVPTPTQGWAPDSPTGFYIHDTLTARIHPARACKALASAIRTLGGDILEGQEAADEGRVLHATGWNGLTQLSNSLTKQVGNGVKGQAALLAYDAHNQPQLFLDTLHIVPHSDGTVAVGSTSEKSFSSPTQTDAQLENLIARAKALCPALAKAPILTQWAGVRPRAASRSPMLGAWSDRPRHFIANGGFKIGFGIAPKVAETMADLLLEDVDKIPQGFRVEDNF